ncbi:acyl-CoA dehydrogenase family protein [Desulfatitalea alkaliphila]|uniref:Acyl-CoA/acyl-ACP dehydrogenase n=1 Tax=Desulfatitalea alkaliphila TaxID=2929485 RepID=A0AA41R0H1_9BACT|nr:acyl-CoA dehydrogenase family protein [Desulfatitalea alkaliphila]MCJ8499296.1 acyl-CoA/acyl-ACP dehydrogenase [Desulfatitalea alkaliphila]
MILLNPKTETFAHLDPRSREIMQKTVEYFESRGKAKLKSDSHERLWYADFINFLKENRVFATLLTPAAYADGDPDTRWDTLRICDLNEILGFYNLSHWYTWQVSILGLGPIWMSGNEAIKKKTATLLKEGGIFAFGLSERAHGADLYSSEMALTPLAEGKYVADGGKYYIGNANKAALVSTFGKNSETDEYVFFAVSPEHPNYDLIQNVVSWEGYVAEYALNGYPITDDDLLSTGRDAWDAALNTVNVGKFNLGWGAIGIATHAFYEALNHAAQRNLYGKWVTDFPHIKQLFVDAYARLVAMKLFSQRATDYFRCAGAQDRRYLLYNPMVKMKVTTQGEEVINLLWDVIAARGFEKDMYFEMAVKDIRSLPKLEGTVHVNMALIIKFMANYFFNPGTFPEIPKRDDPADDAFLFNQGPTKGLGRIQFHDYNLAYDGVDLPNVSLFKEQIGTLKEFLATATPSEAQAKNIDFLLSLGELFTLVAYGQLLLEKYRMDNLDNDLVEQIFDFMVRDFSKFALQIYSKPDSTDKQMALCMKMIKRPVVDTERFQRIWEQQVYALKDTYAMNP